MEARWKLPCPAVTLDVLPAVLNAFMHTTANATSTLALVIGTSGSIFGYRKHLEPEWFTACECMPA